MADRIQEGELLPHVPASTSVPDPSIRLDVEPGAFGGYQARGLQEFGTEAVTVSILPQILEMAKTLNLKVVVEGIETGAQADYFADLESPVFAQGWLFGRPSTVESLKNLLSEQMKDDPDPFGLA